MYIGVCAGTSIINWEIPETGQRIVADKKFIAENFPTAKPCEEQVEILKIDAEKWKCFETLLKKSLPKILRMEVS